ncbi:MAG: aldo/keto reductase [Lachnospiraceae bacterium]|nr:aldo/keto reductase [Lachnospiraceae bacterium]
MQYRHDQKGASLSVLGYGCMRFTKKYGKIIFDKAEREVMLAIRHGVNYLDTAYIYPGSEECLGKILEKNHCRDKVNIATKLPHYLIKSREGLEKCFREQLRRLQTDHIDYYLMHMLTDVATWERLKKLGIEEWIREKLDRGQIRNIGFSYHGNSDMFMKLIDVYSWNFCQIQYNYMDEHTQAGRAGLHYAAAKGLPVIIMEPLRGGRLVNLLPKTAQQLIADSGRTAPEWAFRWLWNQPEVTVVLSGMNSRQMIKENIIQACKSSAGMMTVEDFALIENVKAEINGKVKIGCTGCGYCMPCPQGVDIPACFRSYNMRYTENKFSGFREYFMCTTMKKNVCNASLCVKCGRCEKHCPQGLPIRENLEKVKKEMEGPAYQVVRQVKRFIRL